MIPDSRGNDPMYGTSRVYQCGGEDLGITLARQVKAYELLQFLADNAAARCPKNQSLANLFIDVEELKVLAQFTMVPFLCFLKLMQGRLQCFFTWLNKTIDSNQLFVVLIASPVRSKLK